MNTQLWAGAAGSVRLASAPGNEFWVKNKQTKTDFKNEKMYFYKER